MTTYTCKACAKPILEQDGKFLKSCKHNSGIIAHLTAHATGQGLANGT